MRQIPFLEAAKVGFRIHLSPPATTPAPPPYSNSKEFKVNTALVFVFLFGTLICGLGCNPAIRYLWRRMQTAESRKAEQEREIPAVIYSEEVKLAGAEADCAICLSEFAIGERIRALEKCSHGFHVQCIERWLVSHSSCPTCRASAR
ncbi:hypothetical protein ACS0TY_030956 [Phlomoides rotata]